MNPLTASNIVFTTRCHVLAASSCIFWLPNLAASDQKTRGLFGEPSSTAGGVNYFNSSFTISSLPRMAMFPLLKSARFVTNHLKHRPIPVVHRSLSTQKVRARSPTLPDDVQQFDFLSSEIMPKFRDYMALNADDSIPVCHKKV